MYSRRYKVEEKRNTRRAIVFIILTVAFSILIIFYGIPTVAKFATFIADFRNQSVSTTFKDTTPPPPPRFNSPQTVTNNPKLELNGTSEAGAKVTIDFNSDKEEVLVDSDGKFTHEFTLQKGENTFWATAKDTDGNESGKSSVYNITLDTEPPDLELTSPADGSSFSGSRERQMVLKGKTEPNSKVQVNDRLAIVSSDGSFNFVTTLSEGENNFTVSAEDAAGNKTEKSLKVSFNP